MQAAGASLNAATEHAAIAQHCFYGRSRTSLATEQAIVASTEQQLTAPAEVMRELGWHASDQ